MNLIKRIGTLTYKQLETVGTTRPYAALNHDITVINSIVTLLPNYIFNGVVGISCLVHLAIISIQLLSVVIIFLALSLVVARYYFINKGDRKIRELRELQDDLMKAYQTIIDGYKELTFNEKRKADVYVSVVDKLDKIELSGFQERDGASKSKEDLADLKKEQKTAIAATHDDRYFHLADKLYKYEEGKVNPLS